MADLYNILSMITRGDHHDASVELTSLLQSDPQNVQAWSMLALAVGDPKKKIDCYQRVLQIEPGNSNAIAQLKTLGVAPKDTSASPPPPREESPKPKPVTGSLIVNENEVRLLLVAGELHNLFEGELTLRVDNVQLNPETQAPVAVDFRLLAADREVKEYKNIPAGAQIEYRPRYRYKISIAKNPTNNNLLAMRVRRII
jgi:hypothetical protein